MHPVASQGSVPASKALGQGVFGSLLLAVFAYGCQKPPPADEKPPTPTAVQSAQEKKADDKPSGVPLSVAFNQWVGFAGMYIADERGLFKKHGVDVKLVPFSGPGDSIPPLLAGQIDVSLTTANNLALIAGKQPTAAKIIFMIDASDGADAIVASKSIKTMADLKGKKVAVTKGEINEMLLTLGLESVKLEEKDVTLADMSPDDAGAAFMAGKVDAAVTWEPWVSRAIEKNGHIVYSSKEPGAKDALIDVMAVSDKALASRKSDIDKFVAAFDEGVALVKTDPAGVKAILAKRLEAKPEDVDGMLSGARLYRFEENKTLLKDVLPGTLVKIDAFLTSHKLTTSKVGPELIASTVVTQ